MSTPEQIITKIEKAYEKHGTPIVLTEAGQDVLPTDPLFDRLNPDNNKGTPILTNLKAMISTEPSKAILRMNDGSVGKYSYSMQFYTTNILNKQDFKILYDSSTFEIAHILKSIYRDNILKYEVLVKN